MDAEVYLATGLTVAPLPGPDALHALAAEWEALDEQIVPRSPFTSPVWIPLWWRHFQRRNFLVRDHFFCHTLRDDDGRLVAIAPLMRSRAPGLGLPAIRIVQFFGTDPNITELRGVICRSEDHARVVQALAAYFRRHCGEWDVLRWNGLHHPASHHAMLAGQGQFHARGSVADYILELPGDWGALKARVSSNMRKNLRKAYEGLERDGVRFAVSITERPEEIAGAVNRFLTLHAARSEAAGMINHPNKFATPRERAFLIECMRQFSARGQAKIFEMAIGGKVVASRLTFLLGDDIYFYYAGYQPSWKKYSVMTVLIAEIIQWAMQNRLRRVNLSTGTDQSKLRWKPREITFHNAVQVSPTRSGQIAWHPFRAYEGLSHLRGRLATTRAPPAAAGDGQDRNNDVQAHDT